jgi:hypothetical protein
MLLFGGEVDDTRDGGHGGLDLAGEGTQYREIVTEYFDGDVGSGPGEHMVDAMGNGLADGNVHAGEERYAFPDFGEDFVLRAGLHLEGHVDLGGFDALDMLVEFRASGAAGGGNDLGDAEQDAFEAAAKVV